MRITCEHCGMRYDDAVYWTICPHMPLGSSHRAFHQTENPHGFCREHDLFSCKLHEVTT